MALITTISGIDSDSYVDLVYADAYLNGQLYEEGWASAVDDAFKERALRLSCRRIDMERFKGVRSIPGQRLRWPRIADPDDVYGDWDFYDVAPLSTEIPSAIMDAQCLLAGALSSGNVLEDSSDLFMFKRVKLPGPLEIEMATGEFLAGELPAEVMRLLNEFLIVYSDNTLTLRS